MSLPEPRTRTGERKPVLWLALSNLLKKVWHGFLTRVIGGKAALRALDWLVPQEVGARSLRRMLCAALTVPSLLCLPGVQPAARAEEPKATIAGGVGVTGDSYSWVVRNKHTSPIVYVEFPHYHASLFFAPDGWLTESTFLVNVGVEDRPGVCKARAPDASSGIARGGTGEFWMQIHQAGSRRGQGSVLIRFADGSEVEIPGVEMPSPEAISDKYAPLIGLGGIVTIWMIFGAWRRVRKSRAATSESDAASVEP